MLKRPNGWRYQKDAVADDDVCCCLENDLDSSRLNSLSGDLTDSLIDVE